MLYIVFIQHIDTDDNEGWAATWQIEAKSLEVLVAVVQCRLVERRYFVEAEFDLPPMQPEPIGDGFWTHTWIDRDLSFYKANIIQTEVPKQNDPWLRSIIDHWMPSLS